MDKLPVKLEMQDIETDPPSEPLRHVDPQKTRLRNGYSTDQKKSTVKATPTLEIEINGPGQSTESVSEAPAAPSALPPRQYRLFERIVEHDLKYLKLTCKLGILPFDVDVEHRQVSPTKSTLRWYLFYFITFTCVLKISYLDLSLVASLLNRDWLDVLQFPTHLGLVLTTTTALVYLFLRPNYLRLGALLMTAALAKRNRVKSFSRQQLLTATMPISLTGIAVLATTGLSLLTTNVSQIGTLLRAVTLEWKWESPITYGFLLVAVYALDAIPIFFLVVGIIYMFVSHVLILEVIQSWCDDLRDKTTRYNLADCYDELVNIQIIIGLFNQIYGAVVFCVKIMCFSLGISAFAAVFWYGKDSLIMAAINMYEGTVSLLVYPILYEKAALISGSMEDAKKSLLMATAALENENESAFWRRRIESIRVICILCGPRPIERESLPLFCDFFGSTFIDVLLTS